MKHNNNREKSWSEIRHCFVQDYIQTVEHLLGKRLPKGAEIHHIDGDPDNNVKNNLVVCQDHYYHILLHLRSDALKACGNPSARKCQICGKWDTVDNPDFRLYERPDRANGLTPIHRSCYNKRRNRRKEAESETR